jgi:hypothetical protein
MKMLLIIGPRERHEELSHLSEGAGVQAYTELTQVRGAGVTGRKLGTPEWPDRPTLLFSIVPDDHKATLSESLKKFKTLLYPEEGLRAFILPVEEEL